MDKIKNNKLYAGSGRITVSLHGAKAVLSELSSTYPLKLLSPRIYNETAVVYLLTYGGGLVGGDELELVVDVQLGARLVLLSQGTTKVFKSRLGRRLAYGNVHELGHYPGTNNNGLTSTKQNSQFFVASESVLLLLPEPVTCFRDASYSQIQKFEISEGGSAVILDWITSGRISRGEEWEFSRYYSVNDIWHNGKRIAKDVTLLDNGHHHHDSHVPDRPLQKKLQPYSCYAMLILFGPQVQPIITDLISQHDKISVFKSNVPSQLIWSMSPIDSTGQGIVVRIGGVETEIVKAWLKQALSGIEHIVGKDVYRFV